MSTTKAVSHWVTLLKKGQVEAAQPLWEQYYSRLVEYARRRVGTPEADHEIVAASAFNSFFIATMKGRFPQLTDRNDLWKLLIFITGQKVVNHRRRDNAKRRGNGLKANDGDMLQQAVSREPTPVFAAMVAEEFQRLLDRLENRSLQKIAVWKMEGLTNEEIAKQLDCAVRTVTNKLDLIRKILQEEEFSCQK